VSLVAEEFSGFLVDEMKPRAGETDDGQIGIGTGGIGTGLVRRGRRKPMLHVGAQPWTFEKDMSAHTPEYAELAERVTSVWLRSWTVQAPGKCEVACRALNSSVDCHKREMANLRGQMSVGRMTELKSGHCQNQLRTLGVKYGQYLAVEVPER
jgi:hypothetical protein